MSSQAAAAENLQQMLEQLRVSALALLPDTSISSQLHQRLAVLLKELAALESTVRSNLRLLQPLVAFLRKSRQVEPEVGAAREQQDTEVKDVAGARALQLGCRFLPLVTTWEASGLKVQRVVAAVERTLAWLQAAERASDPLQRRLDKNLRDLSSLSQLLDSCTLVDLGSETQTSKLRQHFVRAGPLFSKLSSEVALLLKDWRSARATQARPEGGVSELLRRQRAVTGRIQQCEAILQLARRFHLQAAQLDQLLQAQPRRMLPESGEVKHQQQQIQHLLAGLSSLKRDIVSAVSHSDWSGFSLDQLDARLLSLDSAAVSWLKEASSCEEQEQREALTQLLERQVPQLQRSLSDLKKPFSQLKLSSVKSSRSEKELRHQLQQLQTYQLRLQVPRLSSGRSLSQPPLPAQGLQQRLPEDLEGSIWRHRKTLETTCGLQQALGRQQSCCEDASATVARLCHRPSNSGGSESVSALLRQLEERVAQMTQLAVRLHGAEGAGLHVHEAVGKHAEVLRSIRELSGSLLLLLREDSLRQEEMKPTEEQEQKANRQSEGAADTEPKETGHTPELLAEQDGPPLSWKRKPPFHPSHSVEGEQRREGRTEGSSHRLLTSTHVLRLSCSPVAAGRRRLHAIHSPPEPPGSVQLNIHRSSAEDLVALQDQGVVWDDSRSSDEYECVSPDDMSLPPLAETPESLVAQWDVEEGACCRTCGSAAGLRGSCLAETLASTGSSRVPNSPAVISPCRACEDAGSELQRASAATVLASSSAGQTAGRPRAPENQTSSCSHFLPTWSLGSESHKKSLGAQSVMTKPSVLHQVPRGGLQASTGPDPPKPRASEALVPGAQCAAEKEGAFTWSKEDLQDPLLSSIRLSPRELEARGRCRLPVRDSRPPQPEGSQPSKALHLTTISNLNVEVATSPSPPIQTSRSDVQQQDWTSPPEDLRPQVAVLSVRDVCQRRTCAPQEVSSPPSAALGRTAHKEEAPPRTQGARLSATPQQCVHDPNVALGDAPPPAAPGQAFAESANLHVSPPSPRAQPLTADEDPDACQPLAVREEVRLTRQIRGPPVPAARNPAKSGPPSFTRPVSGAAVMAGAPVDLELELEATEEPEPALTWCEAEGASAGGGRCHSEADDVRGAGVLALRDLGEEDEGRWLLDQACDLIGVDWLTCFGILCFLLWLLRLLLL
ncbi:uncharacterized protein ccdc141 [Synchiropus splendidus]|uniref:uncharacterized protein ccdc141 n=1 Tax=Synchiropus splendidus TaxID=270530 RepID=UPI00237E2350|nr:uncharacterized protein ccdc141 [Synchiropus splendidus]